MSTLKKFLRDTGRAARHLTKSTKDIVEKYNTPRNREKVAESVVETSGVAINKAKELGESVVERAADLEFFKSKEPTSEQNWYEHAAEACEDISDAVHKTERGWSRRIVSGLAGKFAGVGASAGIFGVASLLGTASTGTAIGSLSGAAFTSAALAWVGGSVVMGSVIIGAATLATTVGGVLGAGWIIKEYVKGKERAKSELNDKERAVVDSALALAFAFREESKSGRPLQPLVANAMYNEALKPLCDELLEYKFETENWPYLDRRRIENAIRVIERLTVFARGFAKKHPDFTVGIVAAVFLKLMADELPEFSGQELLVIDALRRSNTSLTDAPLEHLSAYLKEKNPEQLQGLSNNVKGIYHELRFAHEENTDGDVYQVELFDQTNHPGSDAVLINTVTGETSEIQLKATSYMSHIREHNSRYENVEVFATEEVARQSEQIHSSGLSNDELETDVDEVFEGLREADDGVVSESMAVAALVTVARTVGVNLLQTKNVSQEDKEQLLKSGAISAATAGLVSVIVG